MNIPRVVGPRSWVHRCACLILASLALSNHAFAQYAVAEPAHPLPRARTSPHPLANALMRESVRLVSPASSVAEGAPHHGDARRRLGLWAGVPGMLVGTVAGAAIDCALSDCGRGSPNIPTGVPIGMIVGAVTPVLAPREVGAAFLGIGGGAWVAGLTGAAFQGGCNNRPCRRGGVIGALVGATAGGLVAHVLVNRD